MSKIFRSIYSLAAYVAAAISQSKKAVFAAAAAVVGIGFLTAPIDSVQGQSGIPVVSEVILDGYDFFESDFFDMEVVHSSGSGVWGKPKYCWSGIFKDDWDDRGWSWVDAEDFDYITGSFLGYHTGFPRTASFRPYFHPAGLWEYYICKIAPFDFDSSDVDTSLGWVEVWFFAGGIDHATGEILPPSVAVEEQRRQLVLPNIDD